MGRLRTIQCAIVETGIQCTCKFRVTYVPMTRNATVQRFPSENDARLAGWFFDARRGWLCPEHNRQIAASEQTDLPFTLEPLRKDAEGWKTAEYFGSRGL